MSSHRCDALRRTVHTHAYSKSPCPHRARVTDIDTDADFLRSIGAAFAWLRAVAVTTATVFLLLAATASACISRVALASSGRSVFRITIALRARTILHARTSTSSSPPDASLRARSWWWWWRSKIMLGTTGISCTTCSLSLSPSLPIDPISVRAPPRVVEMRVLFHSPSADSS